MIAWFFFGWIGRVLAALGQWYAIWREMGEPWVPFEE